MTHEFNFLATGIGSLPLTDPAAAVALVRRYLPEAPIWPQLPKRGYREHMGGQYAEGLPGLVEDPARECFSIDSARDLTSELERFFERYLARDLAHFAISERHAAGLHALLRALEERPPEGARFLKGHVTGPLTAGISLKDEQGRDIIHNELLFDVVVKNLAMKAAWQVGALGRFGRPVIVFIDEPAMETLGSAFSAAAPELVAEKLEEIIAAIHELGGIAGKMPVTGGTSVVGFLSTAGIPPLSGFWSKLLIILALFQANAGQSDRGVQRAAASDKLQPVGGPAVDALAGCQEGHALAKLGAVGIFYQQRALFTRKFGDQVLLGASSQRAKHPLSILGRGNAAGTIPAILKSQLDDFDRLLWIRKQAQPVVQRRSPPQ